MNTVVLRLTWPHAEPRWFVVCSVRTAMVFGVVYQFNEPDQTDSVFLLVGPFKVEFYWKVKA